MKKIICGILCIIALLSFSGCEHVRKLKVYDNVEDYVKTEFIEQNQVEFPFVSADGTKPQYPKERVFAINNQEEYDTVFSQAVPGLDVDYDNEMLILYTFSCINKRDFKITSSDFEEGKLEFEFVMYRPFDIFLGPDTCIPYQRFVLIKLNRLAVYSIEFDEY